MRFRCLCCHESPVLVSVVYTAMTGAEATAADSHDHDEVEDIELDHILGFRV